jgi:hypothetical protein
MTATGADALDGGQLIVQLGVAVAPGALDPGRGPGAGGQRGELGQHGPTALAQSEPADAPGGQLVEDGVGGQLGVEDQQPGVGAGGAGPVVGEGDHLAGRRGLGDVGVGVDHLGRSVVLGEEGEHRPGPLGALGDVVLLQRHVAAVVPNRVEVDVEPGRPGGHPELAQAAHQGGEQLLVGLPAHPVGPSCSSSLLEKRRVLGM